MSKAQRRFKLYNSVLFLIMPIISHAYWTRSYTGGHGNITNMPMDFPYSLDTQGKWGGGGNSAIGTITANFTWVPGPYNDPAPDHVYVLETCTANGFSSPGAGSPSADNGLDSDKVNGANPGSISIQASGSRLTYVDLTLGSSFQVSASPFAAGTQSASVRYTADVVPLAVIIDSDRDISFHKGTNGLPESNLTDVASPRYGDTWVDPDDWFIGDGNVYPYYYYLFKPTFSRELIGNWSDPFHEWADGDGFPSTYVDDYFHEFEWISPEWYITKEQLASLGEEGPVTKNINLTVTNNGGSGPSSSAIYRMRIHNKYENWIYDHQVNSIYNDVDSFTVDPPGHALGGGGIQCHWTEAGPYWAAVQSATNATLTVTESLLKNPIYQAGFIAANIGINSLGPKPNSGVAPWAWNWDGSWISGSWDDNQQAYYMIPALEQGYDQIAYDVDEYGPHGFVGVANDVKAKPNGLYRWTGVFWKNDGSDGGPQG